MKTELEKRDILRLSNEESNRITKECLRIAMFKLMGKKDFEKISVTEIAKYAGVSRTAFYRNYETKEALVEDICKSVLSRLMDSIRSERYRVNRKQWYINFFQTIKDNSDYFRVFLSAHLHFDNVLETVSPSASAEERYIKSAKEGAFLRALTDWFRGGMKESPEEMGEICEQIIHRAFE